jgi:hypothetical protein
VKKIKLYTLEVCKNLYALYVSLENEINADFAAIIIWTAHASLEIEYDC